MNGQGRWPPSIKDARLRDAATLRQLKADSRTRLAADWLEERLCRAYKTYRRMGSIEDLVAARYLILCDELPRAIPQHAWDALRVTGLLVVFDGEEAKDIHP